MTARIDHLLIGARSIEPLSEALRDGYGFGVTDGSPNPDGTASWVVPFTTTDIQYLELIVVHDEGELRSSEFGRLFLERTAQGPAFLNWAALVDDIHGTAERVRPLAGGDPGLYEGESVRADGQVVPWAEAGFDFSWKRPAHPFFLRYGNWGARLARIPHDLEAAAHTRTPHAFTALSLCADEDALTAWLGEDVPGCRVTGAPGSGGERVLSATLDTDEGPVELRLP